MGFVDVLKRVLPLSDNDQYCLELLEGEEEYEEVRKLIKEGKAKFLLQKYNISIFSDGDYFQLVSELPELNELLMAVNLKLKLKSQKAIFKKFSDVASDKIRQIISSNVPGMDLIKNTLVLQLASNEDLHFLIFGDNHGIKALVNNTAYLSPTSSVSHASSAMSNDSLFHAKGGICVIHDLMMMHRLDKTDLHTAMNTGFIMKDGSRLDIRAKILATITPSGGMETVLERIRAQLPNEKTLDRFNLILLGKASHEEPLKIGIKKEDQAFIHDYIRYAHNLDVKMSREAEAHLIEFTTALKKHEFSFFMEIPKGLTDTLEMLSKAAARIRLSEKVEAQDLNLAKEIVADSLKGN